MASLKAIEIADQTTRTTQRGIVLVVVMLFLILIGGVSLWGARQSLQSEQAARNQLDHEAARQAAEAALRDAERDVLNPNHVVLQNASCARGALEIVAADFTPVCTRGLCAMADIQYQQLDWSKSTAAEPWWPTEKGGLWNNSLASKPGRNPVTQSNCNFTGSVPLGTFTGAPALAGVSRQPEYLIEYFARKQVRMNASETMVTNAGSNANQWSPMYRVTALGFGYSERTQVLLQSIVFP